MATIYSFKDLSGAIAGVTIGSFTFSGGNSLGNGSIAISMITDKTVHDIDIGGVILVSKVPGSNGTITIECQQSSTIDSFLIDAYAKLLMAKPNTWAEVTILMRSMTIKRRHTAMGVSFQKVPDRTYASQGGRVTWQLMSANIVHDFM